MMIGRRIEERRFEISLLEDRELGRVGGIRTPPQQRALKQPRNGVLSRRRFALLAASGLGLGFSCKNNPAGPSEQPLPPLGEARAVPNSTALQNLNLIVRLAQREHPGAYLFQIDGRNLAPDGRARNSGAPWAYSFRTDGSGSNQFGFYDTWYVYNDGRLEWLLDHQAGRPRLGDILPSLVVDSDRALQLVKANGFQECADLPGARGFVQYRIEGGLVICEAAISGFGGLVLSADKGEILQVGGGCKP